MYQVHNDLNIIFGTPQLQNIFFCLMRKIMVIPYKILTLKWWLLQLILVLWLAAKQNIKFTVHHNDRCTEQSNLSSLHFWVWIYAFFPFLLLTLFSQRQELCIWCFSVVQTSCESPAWTEGKDNRKQSIKINLPPCWGWTLLCRILFSFFSARY